MMKPQRRVVFTVEPSPEAQQALDGLLDLLADAIVDRALRRAGAEDASGAPSVGGAVRGGRGDWREAG